ncbi:MAG: hypothetical protein AB8W78_08970 [Arsenophonus endosymbiont of Dermacentor nuttalli]
MTNMIHCNVAIGNLVPNVQRRQEADPELKRRFDRYLQAQEPDNRSLASGLPSVLETLAYTNSSATVNNVYLLRQGNSLTYRLLNGPMMGMMIIARWEKYGAVHLQLKPTNSVQRQVVARVENKLKATLAGRGFLLSLEIEDGAQ